MKQDNQGMTLAKGIILISAIGSVMTVCYSRCVPEWRQDGFFQLFYLLITLAILYRERMEIFGPRKFSSTLQSSTLALFASLLAGVMTVLACRSGSIGWLMFFFPMLLWSTYYLYYGDVKRPFFFILMCFLSFPVPYPVWFMFSFLLQKGTVYLTLVILKVISSSSWLVQDTLFSAGYSLYVGKPCSGINSFVVLLPLVIIGMHYRRPRLRNYLLIVSVLPFSVVAFNAVRVALMFVAAPVRNGKLDVELFHQIGPLFFILNAAFLFYLMNQFERPACRVSTSFLAEKDNLTYVMILCIYLLVAFFIHCAASRTPGTIDTDKLLSVFRQSTDWKVISMDQPSPATLRINLVYQGSVTVSIISGALFRDQMPCPVEWCLTDPELSAPASRSFQKEILVSKRIKSNWTFHQYDDPSFKRGVLAYTYQVGEKSLYSYTGAITWRGIRNLSGLRYPVIVTKLFIRGLNDRVKSESAFRTYSVDIHERFSRLFTGFFPAVGLSGFDFL